MINNSQVAITECLKVLVGMGYKWYNRIPLNKARYSVLDGNPPILLIYKREWFLTYYQISGQKGWGESINVEHIKQALARGCKVICRTDGESVLFADLYLFVDTGIKRVNKEGKEVYSNSAHLFRSYKNITEAKDAIFGQRRLEGNGNTTTKDN